MRQRVARGREEGITDRMVQVLAGISLSNYALVCGMGIIL
jgi:hypothetical protein